jgi:hypothetical protein
MGIERPAWLTCGSSCPLYPSTFTRKAAIPSSPREDHSTIIPFFPLCQRHENGFKGIHVGFYIM